MRWVAWVAVLAPALAAAQAPRFDDAVWRRLEQLETPVPSPDGRWVAFTRVGFDSVAGAHRATVWVMEDDGGNLREIGPGRLPDWSPDAKRVAMIDAGMLRIVTLDGSAPAVAYAPTPWRADLVRWSPDGRQLALGAAAGDPRITGRATSGSGPGLGQAVLLITSEGGSHRVLTPPTLLVGLPDAPLPDTREFDWIDGATLVVAGRLADSGRAGETALVIIDTLGTMPRTLPLGEGIWHAPVTSPNGKLIAFTGHRSSAAGWTAEELWVVQPNGAGIRRLTPNIDRTVMEVAWAGDNQSLWFATEDRGARNVHRVTTKGDGIKASTTGVHALELGGIARRGNYGVVVREQPLVPPALWRFPTGKPWELRPVFEPNAAVVAELQFGEVEEFEVRAPDGVPVHAWLVRPPDFAPGVRYPLLVEVHGGPHAMAGARFVPARLRHAAEGWLVLVPNARGSTGFGSDFASGIARAWPGTEGDDLLAAVDDVLARGLADSTRMVLLGVGGGGPPVGALLTRTPRFAAALLRCTDARWIALGGGPDVAPGGGWGAAKPLRLLPELWTDRSPVHRARDVRTPVATIAGDPGPPRAVEFAEAFTLGVARTGTRTLFVREPWACGPEARPGVVTDLERWALDALLPAR